MPSYKYETHLHTLEASKCSKEPAAHFVDFYKNLGYSGIIVTDHFFNGNTSVPKNLSWNERIDMFCLGYENALKRGKEIGLDVFFGWEYSYKGTDLLTYGLNNKWLQSHHDILSLNLNEYCDLVHSDGGFLIHAHPFREASYIDMIRLIPRKVDAVEILNGERDDFENSLAKQYADNYQLPHFAGSDAHSTKIKRTASIVLNIKAHSINDIISSISSGNILINEDVLND